MTPGYPELYQLKDATKRHPGDIEAELVLWPFCCKHYSAGKKPEEMLEDVRHAGHGPQSRRHDAHDDGCARNEPGGDAQYRLMHAMLLGRGGSIRPTHRSAKRPVQAGRRIEVNPRKT